MLHSHVLPFRYLADFSNVAILIVVFSFILAASLGPLIIQYLKSRELMRLWHTQRMAAIEKGIELPPMPEELVGGGNGTGGQQSADPAANRAARATRFLVSGLILMGVGAGLFIFFQFSHLGPDGLSYVGFVPGLIGVAQVICFPVLRQKEA